MSWYDYVPLAGSIARLAQGDYKHAGADALGPVGAYAYDTGSAFDEKKKGFQQAQTDLANLAEQQKAFQMEGLNRAEGYYNPSQTRVNQIYGPPGNFRK